MENTYNDERIIEQEQKIISYINTMFQFRKNFNHKLTSVDILYLINNLLNYKFYKCEIYYNIDVNLIHNCMINFGFRFKKETNYYIYNVSIKPQIKKLLKLYND